MHEKDGSPIGYSQGVQEGGQGGSGRRDREGVRGRGGRVRLPDRRGLQGRRGGVVPDDRGTRLRPPRRDRPDRLPADVLPRPGRRRREGLRAARQGDGELGPVGRRALRLPRQAADSARCASATASSRSRTCTSRTRSARPRTSSRVGSRASTRTSWRWPQTLIERFTSSFDHEKYEDEYRARLLKIVKRKRKGEEVHAPPQEKREPTSDLLEALRASVEAAKGSTNGKTKSKTPAPQACRHEGALTRPRASSSSNVLARASRGGPQVTGRQGHDCSRRPSRTRSSSRFRQRRSSSSASSRSSPTRRRSIASSTRLEG